MKWGVCALYRPSYMTPGTKVQVVNRYISGRPAWRPVEDFDAPRAQGEA